MRNYDVAGCGTDVVIYRRLADLVVACHAVVVIFFVIGGPLSWRFVWIALLHIPVAAWVAAVFIMDWTCPLTPLENRLRRAAGEEGYAGGFVAHYLMPFVARPKEKGSTRQEEIVLGVVFAVVSIAVHAVNFARYRDAIVGLAR